jgi:hypothetical protein
VIPESDDREKFGSGVREAFTQKQLEQESSEDIESDEEDEEFDQFAHLDPQQSEPEETTTKVVKPAKKREESKHGKQSLQKGEREDMFGIIESEAAMSDFLDEEIPLSMADIQDM